MKKLAPFMLVLLTALPNPGCGTIFFAQRQKAPHSERMDPNILILDALGLIFWVFPGLIAYGVDFYTGAIYLPPDVMKGEGPFIKDKPGDEAPKADAPKEEPKAEEKKPEPEAAPAPMPEERKPEEPKPAEGPKG